MRQPERGNVGAHQPAGLPELLEDRDFVAQRQQIVRDGQGSATGADAGDPFAVLELRNLRQPAGHIVAMVGGNTLEAADRHRLVLDAPAPAGGLARAIAHPPQNPREDVGVAIHHVCIGEAPLGDQADVLRDIGVGRTGPLAIDDSMEIVGMRGIGGFHSVPLSFAGPLRGARDAEYRGAHRNVTGTVQCCAATSGAGATGRSGGSSRSSRARVRRSGDRARAARCAAALGAQAPGW